MSDSLLQALGLFNLLNQQGLFNQVQGRSATFSCPHQGCPLCAQQRAEQAAFALAQQHLQAQKQEQYRQRCQTYLPWFRAGYRTP